MILVNVPGGQTTLIITILVVAGLTFLGAVALDPLPDFLRTFLGYLFSIVLIIIGFGGLFVGGAFEIPLAVQGIYVFDPMSMGWMAIGAVSFIIGAIQLRQTNLRR